MRRPARRGSLRIRLFVEKPCCWGSSACRTTALPTGQGTQRGRGRLKKGMGRLLFLRGPWIFQTGRVASFGRMARLSGKSNYDRFHTVTVNQRNDYLSPNSVIRASSQTSR